MNTVVYGVVIFIEVFLPIFLVYQLTRRYKTGWAVIAMGVLIAGLEQIIGWLLQVWLTQMMPEGTASIVDATSFISLAAIYGLLAAFIGLIIRIGAFRVLGQRVRSIWGSAAVGVASGGMEAIFIGLMTLLSVRLLLDEAKNGVNTSGMTPDQIALNQGILDQFVSGPFYIPLLGLLEVLAMMAIQITVIIMIWNAYQQKRFFWYGMAVIWYGVNIMVQNFILQNTFVGMGLQFLVLVILLAGSLGILYWIWRKEKLTWAPPAVEVVEKEKK